MKDSFVEVGNNSRSKWGQRVCGDVFLAARIREEGRTIAVLSDGLGHGIKASVLATLTATMAMKYLTVRMDLEKASAVIKKTLPVCKERRISYATFTMLEIDSSGHVNVVEYDNPPYLLLRNGEFADVERKQIIMGHKQGRPQVLKRSGFLAEPGDRIIFHSDGVNQSGMGKNATPLGWGEKAVRNFTLEQIRKNTEISASTLAQRIVNRAMENDGWRSGDDSTCAVVYFRKPRKLLVLTGPPVDEENDQELARQFQDFKGKKVICGGTTAKIISRELELSMSVDIRRLHPQVPPPSNMEGAELVTEGIITLTKALEILESPEKTTKSLGAASMLAELLLDNDEIGFIAGTKINDANQPFGNMNIEFRHTIVKRLATVLEEKYLKKVSLKFL
jgi:hypothetical protein